MSLSLRSSNTSAPLLSTKQLNRALLHRQMLLERSNVTALEAIEQLVGIQAQAPTPPYFALWTRLENFQHEELSSLFINREVVRIALMRSTIHLVSAKDGMGLRPVVQPVLEKSLQSTYRKALHGIELAPIAHEGCRLVEEDPITFNELGKLLAEKWPDLAPSVLSAVVRTLVPLVQVPPRGIWGSSGQAAHTSAESWLGKSLAQPPSLESMLLRYLGAFGPASIKDMQRWSGLSKLRETVEALRPKLSTYTDEQGNELFDLPNAPLPKEDTEAPPRFLSEFDNMLLSYDNRSRIINECHKPLVFTVNGIIRSTILIDGFVCGTWRIEQTNESASLHIHPFEKLSPAEREALTAEGAKLLAFAAASASSRTIVFTK
ncbi:winged helix DNA-binding domain-containing protein [Paenibacillus sinopodophylli]|uniref:winged helix DNA-binding domain-containing protein n=1 Tax=Paenibacillus sinopodophylli TaxID=1837342 RepID=UPI00110CF4EA|nr:winged helix DNA-binding domain-containing protein [Paenibacillus sinopodophylli]